MSKFLYRNEAFYGSGVTDIRKIIKHEVCELGNTDIFRYCHDHYKLSKGLKEDLVRISDEIEDDDLIINEMDDNEELFEYVDNIITALFTEISTLTKKMIKYGVWLAELPAVMEIYSFDDGNKIMEYETSGIVLSDLGYDGKLFAYDIYPNCREYTSNKQS